MTLGAGIVWACITIALIVCGYHGGVLLVLSRALDLLRAVCRCTGKAWHHAVWWWKHEWPECLHWAKTTR